VKSELGKLILGLADSQARLHVIELRQELTTSAGEIICLGGEYEEAKAENLVQRRQLDELCAKIEGDLTTVWDDWHYRRNEEGGFN
jgi:hypothetical protein